MQAYQDLNARIRAFTRTNSKLHFLVCGWSTGPAGLLRNAQSSDFSRACGRSLACISKQLRMKYIRTDLFVKDGIHPSYAGAVDLKQSSMTILKADIISNISGTIQNY